ncbi:hypothetical protein I552_7111 [Mycobacterium xenopi 3993]|nr:hypothetical protein I552_7111 [Mycobacterium xenopi 3993]
MPADGDGLSFGLGRHLHGAFGGPSVVRSRPPLCKRRAMRFPGGCPRRWIYGSYVVCQPAPLSQRAKPSDVV